MDKPLRARGFSLLEIAISLGILAAVLILFQAAFTIIPLGKLAKDRGIALKIATHELEALREGGYAALPASGSFSSGELALLAGGTGSLTVTAYNAKTKEVTVAVSWTEPSGAAPYSVALTTLVTETGGLP